MSRIIALIRVGFTDVNERFLADGSNLALSIRDYDSKTEDYMVKHYKIRKMDNGSFFIAVKRTFPSVVALVNHYRGN